MVQDAVHCFVRYSDTMKTSMSLGSLGSWDKKTTATPGFNGVWRILFSVDGLVLLKGILHEKLMLWNPSIRRCRLVPHSESTEFKELGLGFDPLIKDYKHVGTSSWRTVAAQETVSSSSLETARWSGSVYFKGCLYVLSSTKLIFFDLSKEVFKSVNLPGYKKSAYMHFHNSLALVDSWSSLAVLHFSSHGGSVWVLDDNAAAASSWIMRCTFSE